MVITLMIGVAHECATTVPAKGDSSDSESETGFPEGEVAIRELCNETMRRCKNKEVHASQLLLGDSWFKIMVLSASITSWNLSSVASVQLEEQYVREELVPSNSNIEACKKHLGLNVDPRWLMNSINALVKFGAFVASRLHQVSTVEEVIERVQSTEVSFEAFIGHIYSARFWAHVARV